MSLHAEVTADMSLVEAHDLIDDIEKELKAKYNCIAVIHIDPVSDNDSENRDMKRWLQLVLEEIDPALKFHDCRIVRNKDEDPRITFDLEVPYKYDIKDDELIAMIKERIKFMARGYELDITVDKAEKEK